MRIFLLLLSFTLLSTSPLNYFDNLKSEVKLQAQECLVTVFFDNSTCVKCHLEPNYYLNQIESNCGKKNFKVLGILKCDRDIELKVFKKDINWQYQLIRDDGKCRKKLGVFDTAIMTVFNYNGDKKLSISTGNMKNNSKKIINFISQN